MYIIIYIIYYICNIYNIKYIQYICFLLDIWHSHNVHEASSHAKSSASMTRTFPKPVHSRSPTCDHGVHKGILGAPEEGICSKNIKHLIAKKTLSKTVYRRRLGDFGSSPEAASKV